MCVCGHGLSRHTAARVAGEQPCLAGEFGEGICDCESFRKARAVKKSVCNFSQFLRGRDQSIANRVHRLVGVMTARWVMRRRKAFDASDVKLRRVGAPTIAHRYVIEFLSAWESPGPSNSRLADDMVEACPQLHERVKKHWKGY